MFKARMIDSTVNSGWCFGNGFVFGQFGRALLDLIAVLSTSLDLTLLDFVLQVSDVFGAAELNDFAYCLIRNILNLLT